MIRFDRHTGVDEVVTALDEHGYAVIDGILSPAQVAEARSQLTPYLDSTPLGRNSFEGHKTRRVYALFAKVRAFDEPATHPLILGVLDRVLGQYQFSAPVAIDIGPGEAAQVLHRDDSVYPMARPHQTVVVNTMWPLDEFTPANGATRLLPGSHRDESESPPDGVEPVIATLSPGSVMIYVGGLWHGGGSNQTNHSRLGVIVEYVSSWLRPQETHLLAVPRDVVAGLPSRLQELLGYNIYPPFVGYVDGRHPRRTLDLQSEAWQQAMSPHTG